MKTINVTLLVIGIIFKLQNAFGQSFVDLNFESATIVPVQGNIYYPYAVYANDALPGWTVGTGNFLGTNVIIYNDESLGVTSVQLFGTNSEYSVPPLDGDFSVDLYGGSSSSAGLQSVKRPLCPPIRLLFNLSPKATRSSVRF